MDFVMIGLFSLLGYFASGLLNMLFHTVLSLLAKELSWDIELIEPKFLWLVFGCPLCLFADLVVVGRAIFTSFSEFLAFMINSLFNEFRR